MSEAFSENPLLCLALSAAVPLRVAEYEKQDGPSPEDVARTRRFSRVLGEEGDVLQYGGRKKGRAAELLNALADALAVLAFCPGGVTFAGMKFEGKKGTQK